MKHIRKILVFVAYCTGVYLSQRWLGYPGAVLFCVAHMFGRLEGLFA